MNEWLFIYQIKKLNRNEISILITTDLMSRGIDIKGIETVINYDCPYSTQIYVHRCGRTGRAGNEGTCHSILLTNEIGILKHKLEKINVELKKEAWRVI